MNCNQGSRFTRCEKNIITKHVQCRRIRKKAMLSVLTCVLCRATIVAVALIDYGVSGSLCSCGAATIPTSRAELQCATRGTGIFQVLGRLDRWVSRSESRRHSATAQGEKGDHNVTCIRSSPHHGKPHDGALVMMVLGKVDFGDFFSTFWARRIHQQHGIERSHGKLVRICVANPAVLQVLKREKGKGQK